MSEHPIVLRAAEAFAEKLGMVMDASELMEALRATVIKDAITDPQMVVFLEIAKQYGLNPWRKEIYAFYSEKQKAVVPVVGLDGWSKILNDNPQFDGVNFEDGDGWCRCTIWRKDRRHPTVVTEYMNECFRPAKNGNGPWETHPRRMLRHKAFIQCGRLAFGFSGIYDHDEGERIVEASEKNMGEAEVVQGNEPAPEPKSNAKTLDANKFKRSIGKWVSSVLQGSNSANDLIHHLCMLGASEEQKAEALALIACQQGQQVTDVKPRMVETA